MDFEDKLQRAVQRGKKRKATRDKTQAAEAITEEDYRSLHTKYRLEVTEHIEQCLRRLADQFPGFRFETIVGEKGWGAAIRRDDVEMNRGERNNYYSRLEMVVPPMGKYHVLDVATKATVRNKELFRRNHYQPLTEVDTETFIETLDIWIIEFAEQYAATA